MPILWPRGAADERAGARPARRGHRLPLPSPGRCASEHRRDLDPRWPPCPRSSYTRPARRSSSGSSATNSTATGRGRGLRGYKTLAGARVRRQVPAFRRDRRRQFYDTLGPRRHRSGAAGGAAPRRGTLAVTASGYAASGHLLCADHPIVYPSRRGNSTPLLVDKVLQSFASSFASVDREIRRG